MAFLLAAGAAALVCAQARASTVWLCHPGQNADPCTRSLSFTAVNGRLSLRRYDVGARRSQPIDCLYVYPSVSTETRGNSDLRPGLEETDTAWLQASWFSALCRVFAPMYRARPRQSVPRRLGARPPRTSARPRTRCMARTGASTRST